MHEISRVPQCLFPCILLIKPKHQVSPENQLAKSCYYIANFYTTRHCIFIEKSFTNV